MPSRSGSSIRARILDGLAEGCTDAEGEGAAAGRSDWGEQPNTAPPTITANTPRTTPQANVPVMALLMPDSLNDQ
ncbi:hypothetical protein GCM10009848_59880 [Micromonospora lupini]